MIQESIQDLDAESESHGKNVQFVAQWDAHILVSFFSLGQVIINQEVTIESGWHGSIGSPENYWLSDGIGEDHGADVGDDGTEGEVVALLVVGVVEDFLPLGGWLGSKRNDNIINNLNNGIVQSSMVQLFQYSRVSGELGSLHVVSQEGDESDGLHIVVSADTSETSMEESGLGGECSKQSLHTSS